MGWGNFIHIIHHLHAQMTCHRSDDARLMNKISLNVFFLANKFVIQNSSQFKGDEAAVPDDGCKPTFTERPVIKQLDDDKSGGRILFECRCVGDPKPDLIW